MKADVPGIYERPNNLEPLEDHEDLVVTPKPSPNRFIYLDRRLDRLLQQTGFPRKNVRSSPRTKAELNDGR